MRHSTGPKGRVSSQREHGAQGGGGGGTPCLRWRKANRSGETQLTCVPTRRIPCRACVCVHKRADRVQAMIAFNRAHARRVLDQSTPLLAIMQRAASTEKMSEAATRHRPPPPPRHPPSPGNLAAPRFRSGPSRAEDGKKAQQAHKRCVWCVGPPSHLSRDIPKIATVQRSSQYLRGAP